MNVEELLSQSAVRVASHVTPPPAPDPMDLGARALARRRRLRAGAAAVATATAVAAAVLALPPLGQRVSEPVDLPRPEPLGNSPAWVDRQGDVHVGKQVLDLPAFPEIAEQQFGDPPPDTWVRRFALSESSVVWRNVSEPWAGDPEGPLLPPDTPPSPLYWQAPGQAPVELGEDEAVYVTADPLGDIIVWVTADRQMVTYDVGEHRELDTTQLTGSTALALPPVLFIDRDQVVYRSAGDVWALDLTEGTTTRVAGVPETDVLDYGAGVLVVAMTNPLDRAAGGGTSGLAQLEFRTATGTVRAEPDRLFREGRLSPDGRWFVTSTGYEEGLRTVVLDTGTGRQVSLDLPDRMRGAYPDPWGWAGQDILIVGLEARTGDLEDPWACRPAAGSCEPLPQRASPTYPW